MFKKGSELGKKKSNLIKKKYIDDIYIKLLSMANFATHLTCGIKLFPCPFAVIFFFSFTSGFLILAFMYLCCFNLSKENVTHFYLEYLVT